VEGVATRQAAHIIVVFQGINADCASIACRRHAFGRKRSVDMVVIVIVIVV
jgi:hypothetical protein